MLLLKTASIRRWRCILRRLAAAVVLSLAACAAHASDAPAAASADAHQAKALELLSVLHTQRMVDQATKSLHQRVDEVGQRVIGPDATPDKKVKLAEFETKLDGEIDAEMGWSALGPGFADIYAKTYTDSEMDAAIAFYKSPAGAAFLEKSGAINQQIAQFSQGKIASLQTELNQQFAEFSRTVSTTPAPASTTPAPATPAPAAGPKK